MARKEKEEKGNETGAITAVPRSRMRERISTLPDGTYVCEDYLEYYEQGVFDPVLMRLALTVDGDAIIAAFAGSSAQVPGVVNSSLAMATNHFGSQRGSPQQSSARQPR